MAELALLAIVQDAMANFGIEIKQMPQRHPPLLARLAASSRLEKWCRIYDKVAQEYIEFTYETQPFTMWLPPSAS